MSDFDFGFAPPENPMDDYGPIDEEELLSKTLNNNFDNVDDLIDENKEVIEDKTEDKIDNKKEDKNNSSKRNTNNKKKNKEPQNKNNKNQDDKNNKQTENKNKELNNKKPLYEQLIEEDGQDKDKDKDKDKNKDKDLNKIDEETDDKNINKDVKKGSADKKEGTKNKNRKEKLKDMLKETTMIEDAPQEANKFDIEEVLEEDEQEDKEMDKEPIKTDKSVLDEVLEDISNTDKLEEEKEKNADINTEELKTKNLKPKRSISEASEEKSEEQKEASKTSSKNKQQNNELVEKDKYKNEVIDDIRKQFEEEQKKNKQYVEEELEKREHKSPPPIDSKFLANLVKNFEELFQNVRFYKMSQSTVYEKTLEKGLSVVDIILHFITSMMLGSGIMKLIQTYRMFGNLNGQIVSSYKRSIYGFFAFFFVVPILKMLLIGIFGTLINKRRDTEKDVYKEIFYHIIISSYAIIIPAIAFKLFVDINPQIAILILIPIIYLESSNLRNIINVSEVLGIQTSFSVEFLSFITVYFLMLFSIIKYFYL